MKKIVLTCEHGGAEIPAPYKKFFKGKASVLKTHRALDIGALPIAFDIQKILGTPLVYSTVSRLIIDLNRDLKKPTLFSEFTDSLGEAGRTKIIETYYNPHWIKLTKTFHSLAVKKHSIIHIGVHSMTDNFNGQERSMQLALLYNPQRSAEKVFAKLWIEELRKEFPGYKIARNNPYEGKNGGVTGFFRKKYNEATYMGLELEVNQGLAVSFKSTKERQQFSAKLAVSLKRATERL
jgi:predicted N-formylglutamate amidohydrolase